jgi:ribonuclease P protein component
MSDEAHFPAEQSCPQAASWFSGSQGNRRRSQDIGCSPRTRSQSPVGVNTGSHLKQAADLTTISRRADFLAANRGLRAPMPGFVLLVRMREDNDPAMRIGITVTKKIGNAVVRNRMKRRFRALAREILPQAGFAGADHILIGRAGGIERDFGMLKVELTRALTKLRSRSWQ